MKSVGRHTDTQKFPQTLWPTCWLCVCVGSIFVSPYVAQINIAGILIDGIDVFQILHIDPQRCGKMTQAGGALCFSYSVSGKIRPSASRLARWLIHSGSVPCNFVPAAERSLEHVQI